MLEENSKRLVKAERLAAVGEMSAKIAHEIRNPLVSIGGFARLMEKNLPKDSEMQKYANIINTQTSQLESILTNILDVAKPRKPKFREVEVHQIIQQVMVMMDGVLKKRQIEVDYNFGCHLCIVYGDEKQIYQVLLNLVKNAIEAITENGKIIFGTKKVNRSVEISITDSGRGIEKNEMNHIYDLFYTTKTDGTGLGLSIVKQIVSDHSGSLEIKSKPGKGTSVIIQLPINNKEEIMEKSE